MNIKNYTSSDPAGKSISKIESILVTLGASDVRKSYKDSNLIAISFIININGNTIPFKLPARVDLVQKVMAGEIKRPRRSTSYRRGTMERIEEQAVKTAWKIILDWVEVQAAMIHLQQAEFLEVFLPYVYKIDTDKTFFESLKETKYKALLN